MPICEVARYQDDEDAAKNNGIEIFYRTYGHGPVKVLMIIGLAGTHNSWNPQIEELAGTVTPNDDESAAGDGSSGEVAGNGKIEVCAFDNRGVGLSSVPKKKSEYTTRIMAKDAIALMDHLGWEKAHVFGHSMGAMIACKLAAMVPNRVLSLALLNVTGGGFQCMPKLDRRTLSIAVRFLKAKTPEQRAAVDLDTHYSEEFLEECVGTSTRRAILYQEYVKAISATGMQSNHGLDGQINACWTHKVTRKELESICSAEFPISVIHGRDDVIAQLCHARALAKKLYPFARMVELHGGHLVSHERTEEVNEALLELIKASESNVNALDWTNLSMEPTGNSNYYATQVNEALLELIKASESNVNALEWTNLSVEPTGWKITRLSITRPSGLSFMFYVIDRLQVFLLFLFGLFLLAFEHTKRALKRLKPAKTVRIGATLT